MSVEKSKQAKAGGRVSIMVSGYLGIWRRCWARVMLVTVALILVVLMGGCNKKTVPPTKDSPPKIAKETRSLLYDRELSQVIVYYLSKDERYLVPVTVAFNPTREAAKVAVEKLLAGPQGEGLRPVMPDDVKLRGVYILNNQQTAYIDLTREFLQINDNKKAEMALKALVLTVTELNNNQSVQLLVEGQTVSQVAGVKTDIPYNRPANINSLLQYENQKGVQVYFNDKDAFYFIPVTVALPAGASESDLPRAAIMALLAGPPKDSGLIRTIWPGTTLLDLKIDQGLATVNLSKQSIGYGGGTTAETALVNSLLFTLTQFDEIDRVQLIIEGKKREYLPEGSAIDRPLTRPEQINFRH